MVGCDAFALFFCALRPLAPPQRDKSNENDTDGTFLQKTACRALQSDKKARIAVGGELEAQALLQSEEATGPHSESEGSTEVPTMKMKAMWSSISKAWSFT